WSQSMWGGWIELPAYVKRLADLGPSALKECAASVRGELERVSGFHKMSRKSLTDGALAIAADMLTGAMLSRQAKSEVDFYEARKFNRWIHLSFEWSIQQATQQAALTPEQQAVF